MRRLLRFLAALCLILVLMTAPTVAGTFPTKEVQIIVPWSAGGATDLLFRAVAAVFPKYANGQPLLVVNIPGGGAVPGTMEFLKAKPDGYTLLGMATPIITKIHMSKVSFDVNSFEPVIMLVENPCMIMVPANSPYKNLKDFVEAARKNPGKISIGNGGAGGGTHLVALAFENFVGVEYLHVPFQGGSPCVTAAVGGHVDSIMVSAPEGIPNAEAGQLRVLGVFGAKRHSKFPNVPTAKEQGIDFSLAMWRGVCVQKGTPPEIVKQLHDIFLKCLKDPEFIKKAEELGIDIEYKNATDFGEYMKAEDKIYEELCKAKKLGDRYQ